MPDPLPISTIISDSKTIVKIRIVVHTYGEERPKISDNHWSIFLIHSGDTSSTRINMWSNLEHNDLTGILDWTKHDYTVSNSAITFWDFPAQDGLTVKEVANLIYSHRREQYVMSGGG